MAYTNHLNVFSSGKKIETTNKQTNKNLTIVFRKADIQMNFCYFLFKEVFFV